MAITSHHVERTAAAMVMFAACGLPTAAHGQDAAPGLAKARRDRLVREHERKAQVLYEAAQFGAALRAARQGLELDGSSNDHRLLEITGWCCLRLAESRQPVVSEGRRRLLRQAESSFDRLWEERPAPRPSAIVLGAGRCQQLLAVHDTREEGRRSLLRAESAYTSLIDREEQLLEALRFRMETRFALGRPDSALADAARYEARAQARLEEIDAHLAETRLADYRRALEARAAERRNELRSVQAHVALHHWRAGAPAKARERVERLLNATDLSYDVTPIAELLAAVAPDDPRVEPAHVFRLQHATSSRVRAESALALGRHGGADPATVPALVSALDDPHPSVVREAVTALGELGPRASAAAPRLAELTEHADAGIARRARAALRRIRAR